jgi:hypothetical protein
MTGLRITSNGYPCIKTLRQTHYVFETSVALQYHLMTCCVSNRRMRSTNLQPSAGSTSTALLSFLRVKVRLLVILRNLRMGLKLLLHDHLPRCKGGEWFCSLSYLRSREANILKRSLNK